MFINIKMNIIGLILFIIFIYYFFKSPNNKEEFRQTAFPTIISGDQAFKILCENNETFRLINSSLCS
jgi:hypothetical protein